MPAMIIYVISQYLHRSVPSAGISDKEGIDNKDEHLRHRTELMGTYHHQHCIIINLTGLLHAQWVSLMNLRRLSLGRWK